jgi:hypothetical protein
MTTFRREVLMQVDRSKSKDVEFSHVFDDSPYYVILGYGPCVATG